MRLPGPRSGRADGESAGAPAARASWGSPALPENADREPPRHLQEVARLIRELVRKSGALQTRISTEAIGLLAQDVGLEEPSSRPWDCRARRCARIRPSRRRTARPTAGRCSIDHLPRWASGCCERHAGRDGGGASAIGQTGGWAANLTELSSRQPPHGAVAGRPGRRGGQRVAAKRRWREGWGRRGRSCRLRSNGWPGALRARP